MYHVHFLVPHIKIAKGKFFQSSAGVKVLLCKEGTGRRHRKYTANLVNDISLKSSDF